jgi:glycosyltransferase involved in cell wall biosynthesis
MSRAPRVLFNTWPAAFDVVGGGERQLMACLRELPPLGVETALFDQWRPNFDRCDILHFFSVMGGSLPFCDHVRRRGIPLFISPNIWLSEETVRLYPLSEIRAQLALADRIVCNSDMEASRLARFLGLPAERFLTVYCGFEDAFAVPADPALFLARTGGEPFVLNVGTIEPRKNQISLIRAMKRFPGYKLALIGDIRDKAYAARCFKEGADLLLYQGALAHEDPLLRSALAACAAFVGPGLMETPGIANLEAAAQGAPLVVTEVGSTREYFEDLAVYLEPDSEETVARGLAEALRRGRSEALRWHVTEHFTWKRTLRPLAEAYGGIVPNTDNGGEKK